MERSGTRQHSTGRWAGSLLPRCISIAWLWGVRHLTALQEAQRVDDEPAPRLIFTTEIDGAALRKLLDHPGILETLVRHNWAIALALPEFDDQRAVVVRYLNNHRVPVVAWLVSPPEEGFVFNTQNYPQARACYEAFREWALAWQLEFDAVSLEVAPPSEIAHDTYWTARHLSRRLWLARENALFPAARTAYTELLAVIRQDGYEVHTYQLPLIADDRRAGTTLIQRTLEIVDLPSDLDVLICSSSMPLEQLDYDLGGALIASYGPSADAIAISGIVADDESGTPALPWLAIQRDLLLAAQHTDTIYIDAFEGCAERGLIDRIESLDWRLIARPVRSKRLLVALVRGIIFTLLISARFGPRALAWAGWAVAALLWLRGRRRRWPQHEQ